MCIKNAKQFITTADISKSLWSGYISNHKTSFGLNLQEVSNGSKSRIEYRKSFVLLNIQQVH